MNSSWSIHGGEIKGNARSAASQRKYISRLTPISLYSSQQPLSQMVSSVNGAGFIKQLHGLIAQNIHLDKRCGYPDELPVHFIVKINARLTKTNARLTKINAQLTKTNAQLTKMNGHLTKTNGQLTKTDGELTKTVGRLTKIDGRLTKTDENRHFTVSLCKTYS